jgi:DNA replication protein DnaC
MMRDRAETSRDTSCTFVGSWQLGTARARAEDSEPHMVNKALRTDLLLLDDLGSERNIPSNPIPDVLFERHAQDKATWITTWMQPEDVRQRYGDGIARRVFERAAIIDCAGVVR